MIDAEALRDRLRDGDFRAWYRRYEERRNAREGKFDRNAPDPPPEPSVGRPHALLTCHRKQRYREENAPGETLEPAGRFWVGTRIEEDLVFEYLDERAPAGLVAANSLWVDAPVRTADRDLRIRGLTDPVFARTDGTPVLPTEVKTRRSLGSVDGPAEHHRAQLHAYMAGLSATRDVSIEEGVLLYVSRTTLDARVVPVAFDTSFWRERVVPWLEGQAHYRESTGVPPASPEQDWECDACEYRSRCGRADAPVADLGFNGFVPERTYPRSRVEDALAADEDLALTPTLARSYPDLRTDRPVTELVCEACGRTVPWAAIDPEETAPTCDRCASNGRYARLRGREPATAPVITPP